MKASPFLRLWLALLWLLLSGKPAQTAPLAGPVTTTGDVLSYAWMGDARGLILTRDFGQAVIAPPRAIGVTGLYYLDLRTGRMDLVARNASQPAPAPAGTRVAYISVQTDGSRSLQIVDLTTSAVRDLGRVDANAIPRWTGDGREIMVARGAQLRALNPDTGAEVGTFQRNATPAPDGTRAAVAGIDGVHLVMPGRDTPLFPASPGDDIGAALTWSPDSAWLAFSTRRQAAAELWVIGRDGIGLRRVARGEGEYITGVNWAPDSRWFLFTRTPTGAGVQEQAELWRGDPRAPADSAVRLTFDDREESQPRVATDGGQIAFLSGGNVYIEPVTAFPLQTEPRNPVSEIMPAPALPAPPLAPVAQLAPPASIRVRHTQQNADWNPNCRDGVPVDQIDSIEFETYVKGVTPREMPAGWEPEALKAQAVSARTYGWYKISTRPAPTYTYDVEDWTTDQVMCDDTDPRTDAAVDATRGQYVAFQGQVILAQYSSNNGDPTLSLTSTPYLVAVDDPVAFGDTRNGHGHGVSQVGAQRWANRFAWDYQQILLHYYTNVAVEAPLGAGTDVTAPIGSLVTPWKNWGQSSNRAFLLANASDNSSAVASVDFNARLANGTPSSIAHLTGPPWQSVWDLTGLADQGTILVTPTIADGSGHVFSGNGTAFFLDRTLPTGTLAAPQVTGSPTTTLRLSANDPGASPSGVISMAFSNDWIWEGENQSVESPGGIPSGSRVADASASNGMALRGQPGVNPAGAWYGPYTSALPFGNKYRAYFRLRTDNPGARSSAEIALLDVVMNGGSNVLGLRRLRGVDFREGNAYQEFYVEFSYTGAQTQGLEFRVAYRATSALWLDRILVVCYPIAFGAQATWGLPPRVGPHRVIAKLLDRAGNPSPDLTVTIQLLGQVQLPLILR